MELTSDTQRILDRALEMLRQARPPPADLGDMPCGTGALSVRAAQAGYRVLPYDLDPTLWRGGPVATPERIDLNQPLGLPDDHLDAVVCCEGLEHLENPYRALDEFRRIVRPGGIVLISIPNTVDLRQRLRFLRRGYFGHYAPRPAGHINAMGPFLLCHALLAREFEILDIDVPHPYGGLKLRLLAPLFRFREGCGLPRPVRQQLSHPRVLCGRTVIVVARAGK